MQPDGLDPCDLRLKHGDAAVRDLIAQRVPLFEFAIRGELAKHNLDTAEGRLAALDAAAPIVARIKDHGLRQLYAVSLDRWLGMMDEHFVLARVRGARGARAGPAARPRRGAPDRAAGGRPAGAGRRPAGAARAGPAGRRPGQPGRAGGAQPTTPPDPVIKVEREALKLAMQRPALCGPAFDAICPRRLHAPGARRGAGSWSPRCGGGRAATPGSGRHGCGRRAGGQGPRLRDPAGGGAARVPRADGEPDARYADAVLARVGGTGGEPEIAAVKSRLQRLNPVDGQATYNRISAIWWRWNSGGRTHAGEGCRRALTRYVPHASVTALQAAG